MKKIMALILAICTLLSLAACSTNTTGNNENASNGTEGDSTNRLSQTVSTDLAEFTLDNAQFAVALNNVNTDDHFIPKEYDAETDSKNPYVAGIGHTLVFIEFTVNNLDRTSLNLEDFISFKYKKSYKTYSLEYGAKSEDGFSWETYDLLNILLLAGEQHSYRCYIDFPEEVDNLTDSFSLKIKLPTSSGSNETFEYTVTETDRANLGEKEVTLGAAIKRFDKDEGKNYFSQHMNEYSNLTGDEISSTVKNNSWSVIYIIENLGSWSGTFKFTEDGRIKDDYGYANNRTWEVDGDILIINDKYNCTMKKSFGWNISVSQR